MSAAAVRPVVARANVARRYVPHANVARGAADRFRRRASHRDWDRNARVEISRRRERGARRKRGEEGEQRLADVVRVDAERGKIDDDVRVRCVRSLREYVGQVW